ncbi:MAG: peptidylprolyl isomerase [Planctomycetes bacterium]|nr:peptidylprolyl isomerase [Planctomycetota bacterium]
MRNWFKAATKPAKSIPAVKMAPGRVLGRVRLSPKLLRNSLMLLVVAAISVAAFCWGRMGGASYLTAQEPNGRQSPMDAVSMNGTPFNQRVVGYLYDNIPITRAELGDYLIDRFGAERLDFLINRRIVEMACKEKGIYVTDQEVEAAFAKDLESFRGMSAKEFNNHILKKFNKTLFEWKEDVIRPKLALQKLCRPLVQVSDADLKKAFEAKYGPKVICRMIVIQKLTPQARAHEILEKARMSEEGFREMVASQFLRELAREGGRVPPIHKNFEDPDIEREAFALREGEVSSIMTMKDGNQIILKCDRREPADQTKQYDRERVNLYNEMFEIKLGQKIQEHFAELRRLAHPRNHLVVAQTEQATSRELQSGVRPGTQELKK